MISALVGAGLEGGYLANPRLAKVHWQAGDRPLPPPRVTVAGESALWARWARCRKRQAKLPQLLGLLLRKGYAPTAWCSASDRRRRPRVLPRRGRQGDRCAGS